MLNGDGLRVVLWLSGCTHHCEECHNPQTWDINGGIEFDQAAEQELYAALESEYISGLTLSGGDPLHPEHMDEVLELVKEVRNRFPQKTIWLYTGYLWEDIQQMPIISLVDVVVDGPFVKALLDPQYHWAGSTNQRVIDVKATLAAREVVLHCKTRKKQDEN